MFNSIGYKPTVEISGDNIQISNVKSENNISINATTSVEIKNLKSGGGISITVMDSNSPQPNMDAIKKVLGILHGKK